MALTRKPIEIVNEGSHQLLVKAPSWERVFLGEIADVQNGAPFESKMFTHSEGIPLIRIRDICETNTVNCYNGSFEDEFLVSAGDILIGMDGDFTAARWKGPEGLLNQRVCRLQLRTQLYDEKFLFLCLQPFLNAINAETSSVTVKHLSSRTIAEIPLPLPPHHEQLRIVAKIEELFSELDAAVANLNKARAQLAVYRQALLKHAFEGKITAKWQAQHATELESGEQLLARIRAEREARYQKQIKVWEMALKKWEAGKEKESKPSKPRTPLTAQLPTQEERDQMPTLPVGWHWMRLGSCNVDVFDGPFGSHLKTSDYVGAGIRVVRLENIGVLKFMEEKESFITEAKYKTLSEHTVVPGDIVFSSFITERTRVAMVPPSIDKAVNKADCFCVRCHGTVLMNRYTTVLLSTRSTFKQLEDAVHGVGRPRINTTQLKELFIPVCSPAEQQELMNQVDAQFSEIGALEADIDLNLQKAEALRQSILKKAFAGELVPQDLADEPAAALLARIRAERETQAAAPKLPKTRTKKA